MSWIMNKPWGYEKILAVTPQYTIKFLVVKKGHSTSLQYHKVKNETWVFPNQEVLHIPAGTVHRLVAKKKDIRIIEVSTSDLMDVERLGDQYGRK